MPEVASKEHKKLASFARDLLATYKDSEDLISIGAYVKGSNKKVDTAIKYNEALNAYLMQGINEQVEFDHSIERLLSMFN